MKRNNHYFKFYNKIMDIRQLRVGNLVTTNGTPEGTDKGGIYKVLDVSHSGIFKGKFCVQMESNESAFSYWGWNIDLEPIEITPDLLSRLGFKSTGWARFNTELSVYNIEIFDIKENNHVLSISLENKNILSCYFKYLHQLQNIIFDITDLDLNVDNLITK